MTDSIFSNNESSLPSRIQIPRLGAQQRKFLVRLLLHRGYWHAEARWGRDTVSETHICCDLWNAKDLLKRKIAAEAGYMNTN